MRPGLSKAHLAVPPALVWSRGNARAMRQRTKHTHSASVEPCGQASAKHTWRYPQRSCGQGATPGPSHREPSTHTAQHSAIVAVITVRPGMNRGPPEGDRPRACARATAPSHTHNSSPGHLYNGPLALTWRRWRVAAIGRGWQRRRWRARRKGRQTWDGSDVGL